MSIITSHPCLWYRYTSFCGYPAPISLVTLHSYPSLPYNQFLDYLKSESENYIDLGGNCFFAHFPGYAIPIINGDPTPIFLFMFHSFLGYHTSISLVTLHQFPLVHYTHVHSYATLICMVTQRPLPMVTLHPFAWLSYTHFHCYCTPVSMVTLHHSFPWLHYTC